MRSKLLAIAAIAVLGAGAAFLVLGKQTSAAQDGAAPAPVIAAQTGSVTRVLRLSGQTSARSYVNINAPTLRGPESGKDLVLMMLAKSGAMVKKGELIAQVDAQSTADHVSDVAELVREADADVAKRKAEQAVEWETLQQTLRVAKASLDKARLDAKTTVLLTEIERELLKLNAEEAEARYAQLQKDLIYRKESFDAEIRILEITKERQARHHDRHAADLKRFTIYSPIAGLAVMQSTWRGGDMGQVQQGDRLGPGQLFMKVVKPESMQLEASANQTESSGLRIGQRVQVTLDAFPGSAFPGRVYSIGALATRGWRDNYFIRNIPVRVAIEANDARLIPDMSAAADIILDKVENAVVIPLKAVRTERGQPTVAIRQGSGFVAHPITLGLDNGTDVAVSAGLNAGDQIRLNQ